MQSCCRQAGNLLRRVDLEVVRRRSRRRYAAVDVTPPALLPPEPDGELLELKRAVKMRQRESAEEESGETGFPHDEIQCNANYTCEG